MTIFINVKISMSARKERRHVIRMLHVKILREASRAPVMMGIKEMETAAQVKQFTWPPS